VDRFRPKRKVEVDERGDSVGEAMDCLPGGAGVLSKKGRATMGQG
jgi:hypothetical protein